MQSSDHVDLRNADGKSFAHCSNDVFNRTFKRVGITLLRSEGTELTGENANIRIVDVAIDNITGEFPIFATAHFARNQTQRIEIIGMVERHRLGFGNALLGFDFFRDRPKCGGD